MLFSFFLSFFFFFSPSKEYHSSFVHSLEPDGALVLAVVLDGVLLALHHQVAECCLAVDDRLVCPTKTQNKTKKKTNKNQKKTNSW